MKRTLRVTIAAILITVFSTTAFTGPNPRRYEYFSDGTYSTMVGAIYFPGQCPESPWEWGSTSNYRLNYSLTDCSGGGAVGCQEYYNGSWHWVTCPW